MKRPKRGRKRLGEKKRGHCIMLRFNDTEYGKLEKLFSSHGLDIDQRGITGPFLRKLLLQGEKKMGATKSMGPKLAYHLNRVGNNINQLAKLAHHKNRTNPKYSLEKEIERTNNLMRGLLDSIKEFNIDW